MRGTLTGGSVGLLRYPAMLPCFSRLWGMILHCRKSPCRLEITADSRGLASGFSCLGDHPRVCGEHATGASTQVNCTGSSPRMRGTPAVTEATNNTARIIPAYAGNTPAACWKSWQAWDHPRVCGEHQSCLQRIRLSRGSSPRMRGTLRGLTLGLDSPGIIPAYAGNTSFEATFLPDPWDHPRVCGEHSPQAQNLIIAVGSSPHMRGTPLGLGYELARQWIIPAYAGNTRLHHASAQAVRDHPRICGEHDAAADAWVKAAGSSPHMRGTPVRIGVQQSARGIIPAYAGNTSFLLSRP